MRYKLLIFDLDNTIFDFTKAEDFALRKTFSELKIDATDALINSYYEINSKLWKDFENGEVSIKELKSLRFSRLVRSNFLTVSPDKLCNLYINNLGQTDFLLSGAFELLKELSESFLLTAITNGISSVQRARLKKTNLDKIFKHVIISEDVGVAKPNPIIFEKLLHKAGHSDKSTVLMIGDGFNSDVKGAINIGIDSCWYNPKKKPCKNEIKPFYTVSTLDEIKDIV